MSSFIRRRVPVGHGQRHRLLRGTGCLLRLAQRLNSQLKLLQAENGMAKKAMAEVPVPWNECYPSASLFSHLGFGMKQASNSRMPSHAPGVSLVMFLSLWSRDFGVCSRLFLVGSKHHCDRSRACEVCFVIALLCQGSCPDSLRHGTGESTEQ